MERIPLILEGQQNWTGADLHTHPTQQHFKISFDFSQGEGDNTALSVKGSPLISEILQMKPIQWLVHISVKLICPA